MKQKIYHLISLAITLCLVVAFSTVTFAEAGNGQVSPRYIPHDSPCNGRVTVSRGVKFFTQYDWCTGHFDGNAYKVDANISTCNVCGEIRWAAFGIPMLFQVNCYMTMPSSLQNVG